MSVVIERLYDREGTPIRNYPRRGKFLVTPTVRTSINTSAVALVEYGERVPPQVIHPSENVLVPRASGLQPRPLKRTYALLGKFESTIAHDRLHTSTNRPIILDINEHVAPAVQAPTQSAKHSPTQTELLQRLDSETRGGITEIQFLRLFAKCECGLITTRRAFENHTCIIDISDD